MTDYTSIADAMPDARVLVSYGEHVELQDNGGAICISSRPQGRYKRQPKGRTNYWGDVSYTPGMEYPAILWNSADVARYIKRWQLAPKGGGTLTHDIHPLAPEVEEKRLDFNAKNRERYAKRKERGND